jgi:hypothetical protein
MADLVVEMMSNYEILFVRGLIMVLTRVGHLSFNSQGNQRFPAQMASICAKK